MNNLTVITSNRLENLAIHLGKVLDEPLTDPLTPEVIVVQSKGMERWLSLQLAKSKGVFANALFYFPTAFVESVFSSLQLDNDFGQIFTPKIMAWKIMAIMPQLFSDDRCRVLKDYCSDDPWGLKTFQLSRQLADTFDQYLLFRPDLIEQWDNGAIPSDIQELWQALLWRKLSADISTYHRAALRRSLLDILQQGRFNRSLLPARLTLFGISYLPPFHWEILAAVAQYVPCRIYVVSPCREFWDDLATPKKLAKAALPENVDLHFESVNSLLASLGTLGREFMGLIHDSEPLEVDAFEPATASTVLHTLQREMLELTDDTNREQQPMVQDDDSVIISVCHNPLREVETLRDYLLDRFQRDPSLSPNDVLVLTPDLSAYAPLVRAVFGAPGQESQRIPFSISDHSLVTQSPCVSAFYALLDLEGSRFGSTQIIGLLEQPPIRTRFKLDDAALEQIRGWLAEARVRWGLSGADKADQILPTIDEHTWKTALNRLYLGYMMANDSVAVRGIVPLCQVGSDQVETLATLEKFIDACGATSRALGEKRTLTEWAALFVQMIEQYIVADANDMQDLVALRETFGRLSTAQQQSGYDVLVCCTVVRDYLTWTLCGTTGYDGFLRGGMTVCALLPMRCIPSRLICLLGCNSETFPRTQHPPTFDLISAHPRPGDRNVRAEDRYLFLESIISARDALYISYTGRSEKENKIIPPSSVVDELIDYIDLAFSSSDGARASALLTRVHRLQPGNPAYFCNDKKLFSYSQEYFNIAKTISGTQRVFFPAPLDWPVQSLCEIDLADLSRFFTNPSRYLCQKRLQIFLASTDDTTADCEPFDVNNLDRYMIVNELMTKGADHASAFERARGLGLLPHGNVAVAEFDKVYSSMVDLMVRSDAAMGKKSYQVDLAFEGLRLCGTIDSVSGFDVQRVRPAAVGAKDRIRLWIELLAFAATVNRPDVCTAHIWGIGNKKDRTEAGYRCVADPRAVLYDLLKLYTQGMRQPLRFFPKTSWEYVDKLGRQTKSRTEALQSAQKIWIGSDWNHGEFEDAYFRMCFSEADPLTTEFETIAINLLQPMFDHEL